MLWHEWFGHLRSFTMHRIIYNTHGHLLKNQKIHVPNYYNSIACYNRVLGGVDINFEHIFRWLDFFVFIAIYCRYIVDTLIFSDFLTRLMRAIVGQIQSNILKNQHMRGIWTKEGLGEMGGNHYKLLFDKKLCTNIYI